MINIFRTAYPIIPLQYTRPLAVSQLRLKPTDKPTIKDEKEKLVAQLAQGGRGVEEINGTFEEMLEEEEMF